MKKKILYATLILAIIATIYVVRFYPKQTMPFGEPVTVLTPYPEKYHNDCLHPCIRKINDSTFIMIQSPYYRWDNTVENPMLYISNNPRHWTNAVLLADTPEEGSPTHVSIWKTLTYLPFGVNSTRRSAKKREAIP